MTTINIQLEQNEKIYLISDIHLGMPAGTKSLEREKKVVAWLDQIKSDAKVVLLVGDIFDFWFSYKYVVPKGFIRLQGKLAELADSGIQIYWFLGNHDMWIFDYFEKEIGVKVIADNQVFLINNKKYFIGHGDGYGPGDNFYKFIKFFFRNKLLQFLFTLLPPALMMSIAFFWSGSSRASGEKKDQYLGDDEWLLQYCKTIESKEHHDYYIFGHRHLPLELKINESSTYYNLGDWLKFYSYGIIDQNGFVLKK